jgi:hypothetical protein
MKATPMTTDDVLDALRAHNGERIWYVKLAVDEIERLRRERDDLAAFLAGIGRQASEMTKSYKDKRST